ncbi:MAG TPA: TlpA disulfide reductase family protein [Gammaproteobacteria bacterium]|nr:TlpA disulfide reductase family protein [Gammaproteobacteria bacterium]
MTVRLLAGAILMMAAAGAMALPTSMTPIQGRPDAPDFQLKDLDGQSHSLADLRGKVVLVNFWASWCPPCREEMPSIQRLYKDLKGRDFQVLAVNVGEEESNVFSFARGQLGTKITFPLLLDPDAKVINRFPVKGLPTSFLVDRKGRLAYKAVGGRSMDKPAFKKRIVNLLGQGQ